MDTTENARIPKLAMLFAAVCFAGVSVRSETVYDGADPEDAAAWKKATESGLTVPAGDTVALTNGVFELDVNAGTPTFGAGSLLKILKEAELFATNSPGDFVLKEDDSQILLDGGYLRFNAQAKYAFFKERPSGCRWDLVNGSAVYVEGSQAYPNLSGSGNVICVVGSTNDFNGGASNTHRARSMKFINAEDCVWAFTNSFLKTFTIGFGNSSEDGSDYSSANYNGYAGRNRLIFHNSAATLYQTTRGLHFGARILANQSFSNRVEVTGDSCDLNLRRIQMRGFSDVFRMEGGMVSCTEADGLAMTGEYNRFENAGGTLETGTGGISLANLGNVLEISGGTVSVASSKSVAVNGVSNRIELVSGLLSGSVTLNGTNGVFRVTGGHMEGDFVLKGVSNRFEYASGVITGKLTVAGRSNVLYIGSGAILENNIKSTTKVGGMLFSGATNSTVVLDDGTFVSRTSLAGMSGSKPRYWINCPGSAIEFRGNSPSLVFPDRTGYWQQIYIGMTNETYVSEDMSLPDPVRMRYIPPEGNFAKAPLSNETTYNRAIRIYGNAVFEVSDENMPRSRRTKKVLVPLVYCSAGFDEWLENENRMKLLNVNAILPEDARLVYEPDDKTLYCLLPQKEGFVVFCR